MQSGGKIRLTVGKTSDPKTVEKPLRFTHIHRVHSAEARQAFADDDSLP
jgi:hypothetical protein